MIELAWVNDGEPFTLDAEDLGPRDTKLARVVKKQTMLGLADDVRDAEDLPASLKEQFLAEVDEEITAAESHAFIWRALCTVDPSFRLPDAEQDKENPDPDTVMEQFRRVRDRLDANVARQLENELSDGESDVLDEREADRDPFDERSDGATSTEPAVR